MEKPNANIQGVCKIDGGIWQIGGPAEDPGNRKYSLENRV